MAEELNFYYTCKAHYVLRMQIIFLLTKCFYSTRYVSLVIKV
jgi:hypothetical protein